MNIWILTIGSSDVQLDSNSLSKKKGRTENNNYSDKIWNYWYTDELKTDYNLPSSAAPTRTFSDKDELYRIAPRILGTVYRNSSESCQQEILTYLTFPLLDNFVAKLKARNLNNPEAYPLPEAIVLLLTDQSAILSDYQQRRKLNSPYWQDTCELEPILRHYLNQKFPNISCEAIFLNPTETGLDNWDSVLNLVGDKFKNLNINDRKVEISTEENVYVSHQAGTPAISSAVQFSSLGKFGDRVRFLVSNEYNSELTDFVPSCSYLLGIKREQAKELLKNYDYAGVDKLVRQYLNDNVKILLDAAIQWNYAEFERFSDFLKGQNIQYPDSVIQEFQGIYPQLVEIAQDRTKQENWWWTAYESAYLSLVRLRQSNIIESTFHSFRAVEGLLLRWAEENYQIKPDDTNPKDSRKYIWDQSGENRVQKPGDSVRYYVAFGKDLYNLFKSHLERDKKPIKIPIIQFGNVVFDRRNELFHQLKGLHQLDFTSAKESLSDKEIVFKFWEVDSNQENDWITRIIECLNCVSNKRIRFIDFSENFQIDDEIPSLMLQVHQELTKAIVSL